MKCLKVIFATAAFMLFTINDVSAQLFPRVRSSLSPGNQQIVLSALKDAMCVIPYEYQLEDTLSHERFNVEGKDYFGFTESLCIKTKKGWIAKEDVIEPWSKNNDVKKFPAYIPVLSSISILASGDSTYRNVDYYPLDKRAAIPSSSFVIIQDSVSFGGGLVIGERSKKSEGYVVWLTRVGNKLSLTSYSHSLPDSLNSTVFSLGGKAVPEGVVGGMYVKETYPEIGTVRLELLGIMERDDNEWKIVMISSPETIDIQSSGAPKLVSASEKKASGKEGEKDRKNKKNK